MIQPQNNSQNKLLGGKVFQTCGRKQKRESLLWPKQYRKSRIKQKWSPLWHHNKSGAKYGSNVFWCDLNSAQLLFSDLEISELNLQHVFLYLCILFISVYLISESVCLAACVCHLHVYNLCLLYIRISEENYKDKTQENDLCIMRFF